MPASEHMMVVEKRRILPRTELTSGRDRGPKSVAARRAENRPRNSRFRREKVSVENDS